MAVGGASAAASIAPRSSGYTHPYGLLVAKRMSNIRASNRPRHTCGTAISARRAHACTYSCACMTLEATGQRDPPALKHASCAPPHPYSTSDASRWRPVACKFCNFSRNALAASRTEASAGCVATFGRTTSSGVVCINYGERLRGERLIAWGTIACNGHPGATPAGAAEGVQTRDRARQPGSNGERPERAKQVRCEG